MSNAQTPAPLDVFECPLAGVNLIEASAGTGKTWTICGLYLRLLLEREFTVQQILVVTFTNAATAELRERIRTRLLELLKFLNGATPGEADPFIRRLADDLLEGAGRSQEDVTARLELALHSFDEAAIFTIHGFCQRALADNPFAAGLPLRTELLETDGELVMEAVHDFWRRHVAHESMTPEFARHLRAMGDSPEVYAQLLRRHLAKPLARHLWPPALRDPPLPASVLHAPYQAARSRWLAHRAAITALLHASLGSLHGNTYKPQSLLEAATLWDELCRDDDPLADVAKKAHLLRSSVLSAKTKKKCTTPSHAFFADAESYLSLRDALDQSLFLERCRLLERLFAEASLQLQTLKRSRHVVAFNDMLANLLERLQHPDYPWLATSLRTRFPAALIDEFQDTDPLQLAIFRKIYDTDDSVVFLVGDPKQAIYSFRHADLHSYLRATRWAGRQWSLTDNQRSSRPLLAALNRLFGSNDAAFVLPDVQYRPVEYGTKSRAPFVDGSEARAPLQVWRLPDRDGELPKARARQAAVEATAAEIARLLTAGLDGHITLDGRALRPGDIAVLVRNRSLGGEVKRALAALRVGAVELSRDSIFSSPDAKDWETVLTAIASPARESLMRAALATEIFGCDAPQIERIAASETLLPGRVLQFMEYRDLWVNRGFGVMVRQLFTDQAVARRLLARADGERRLTNCLHVAEELQQAAQSNPSPEALLRHFKSAQQEKNPGDAAQLRLESDEYLVQIVTIHTCKGLEYPIVFCPFLCDGGTPSGRHGVAGYEYHDPSLLPVIDFNRYEDGDPALTAIKAQIHREQAAETVRLMYVALTRAVHRCYLVVGPYQTQRPKDECARSMLNWLVAGSGRSPRDWFDSALSTQDLDAAWAAAAAASGGALVIDPLPTRPGVPLGGATGDTATLSTPAPPPPIAASWRLSSYSGLSYGARSESAAGDHDARTIAPAGRLPSADLAQDDILRFPRGPNAGDCIHAVFETIDFTDRSGWAAAVATALLRHPQARADDPGPLPQATLNRMLLQLLDHVTDTALTPGSRTPGLRLSQIPLNRRLTELEFNLSVPHLSAAALNATLEQLGYEVPSLTFGALEGYLKGFIDLVFEHRGQYFILDWKSNHLGYTAADYAEAPLARAMAEHGYHLQYLLYAVALDRYLRMRIADYRYETHFGGVLYLFVRGVRPSWPPVGDAAPGVFFHRPAVATIRALNQVLGAPSAALSQTSAGVS
jgi:exodeoxyribonuclease V beta subunit